ncbi:MAG: methyltransferase domain-containing protein [Pseudomonadota bacterium]
MSDHSDEPEVLRVLDPLPADRLTLSAAARIGGVAPRPAPPTQPSAALSLEEKSVPVLKRLERYFSAFFKLGRISRMAKSATVSASVIEPRVDGLAQDLYELTDRQSSLEQERDTVAQRLDGLDDRLAQNAPMIEDAQARVIAHSVRLDEIETEIDPKIEVQLAPIKAELAEIRRAMDRLSTDSAQLARGFSELSRRLDLQRFRHGEAATDTPPASLAREGLDALLDSFYGRLEDRYRGSREQIKQRLAVAYLQDVRAAVEATEGRPVLDLGCGRGEWVELVLSAGIEARGVDLNPVQIADAKAAGLPVEHGDAMAALAAAPDGVFAVVTAHHLIEHLPFDGVAWMAREALRVLAPGGVLIVETPNARNLIVGATTFHIDPTHVRPLPAEVLTTLFDTIGFAPVEPRPLHPSDTREGFLRENRADPHVAELLFGPQDLAVLATRPAIL